MKPNLDSIFLNSLLTACQAIKDPRNSSGRRHSLAAILALMVVATLCGENDNKHIILWGKENSEVCQLLGFKKGIPLSEATLCRICKILPLDWYDIIIKEYKQNEPKHKQICIDGKRSKGKHGSKQITVTAFVAETRTVVGVKNATFGKELSCVRELLEDLNLEDTIVTADALSTQLDIVKKL